MKTFLNLILKTINPNFPFVNTQYENKLPGRARPVGKERGGAASPRWTPGLYVITVV
jgi:hypothetical protein